MDARQAIHNTLDTSDMVLSAYLNDLTDADLHVAPIAGMNPIAWQIGHLISAERSFVEGVKPGSCPALPAGFEDTHPRDPSKADAGHFLKVEEYKAIWAAQRQATKNVLDSMSPADLDAPGPESLRGFSPTVGTTLNLAGTHALMHFGQFVAVRRHLGKPNAI